MVPKYGVQCSETGSGPLSGCRGFRGLGGLGGLGDLGDLRGLGVQGLGFRALLRVGLLHL